MQHDFNHESFPPPQQWQSEAFINTNNFREICQTAINQSDFFWSEQALRLNWIKPWNKVQEVSYQKPINIKWFLDGKLNISENCIDRHLFEYGNRVAFFWEPEDPTRTHQTITYNDLHKKVCKLSNALKDMGVKKGDRVTIYLPMIPEAVYSMLACARIGAVHSVVFAGFSPTALADRIVDCDSHIVITANEGYRGGKSIPLKSSVDEAIKISKREVKTLVVKHTEGKTPWRDGFDFWYHELTAKAKDDCAPEPMDSEDPLFILYTSGSTNKPKGVLHSTGGYLTYASYTHEMVFNYRKSDTYWCAADVGWITGHSYIVYGPLSNCATSVLYEGVPTYPTASRIWEIVDKFNVNTLYTAPTLIRALMGAGDESVNKTSRSSLRLLGSVGEPINKEAWLWYHNVVGKGNCPIVDTWWQTETGGILISPLPGATATKPGSATFPLPGIEPCLVDEKGQEIHGEGQGHLCLKRSWPGQMRGVYGDPERFYQTYFCQHPGMYFTGDGCKRDKDGYYWITGRVDDVLNVSGHRLGTAEIESCIGGHNSVAESAVVGYEHPVKGQGIYVFVTLKSGIVQTDELKRDLNEKVRNEISPIAQPDFIQWAPGLPKTRSGKIMRRILRKVADNTYETLGDTSTLADPSVVQKLIEDRLNK